MIAARACIYAAYDTDGSTELQLVPVEAWGDDGSPYVLGPAGLVAAGSLTGFVNVRYQPSPAIAMTKPCFDVHPHTVQVHDLEEG